MDSDDSDFFDESLLADDGDEDEEQFKIPDESKISRTLSDRTIKAVVCLVLALLFLLPVMSGETYLQEMSIH